MDHIACHTIIRYTSSRTVGTSLWLIRFVALILKFALASFLYLVRQIAWYFISLDVNSLFASCALTFYILSINVFLDILFRFFVSTFTKRCSTPFALFLPISQNKHFLGKIPIDNLISCRLVLDLKTLFSILPFDLSAIFSARVFLCLSDKA